MSEVLHDWLRRFELGKLHDKTSGLKAEEGNSDEARNYRNGIIAPCRLRRLRG